MNTSGKLSAVAAALSVNPLFAGLGADAIQRLASLCVSQTLSEGEVLFQKGDAGDALYGIRRGRILITANTADGKQLTLNVLGAGDMFGEVALLDGQPRTADAVAASRCELFVIRRADLIELLRREPGIALRIIELLCERVRWASERVEEVSMFSLSRRLARRLLKLADDFGDEIQISQEQLSVLVGAARETINRQLQEWRRARLIDLGRGRIVVVDGAGLRALAGV